MNYIRITRNKSSYVRTRLCIEDVAIAQKEGLIEFGLLRVITTAFGEEIYVFRDAFRLPKFNVFYASKIKSVSDPYLNELIGRLLYLNPYPDEVGVKRMAEFIGSRFIATRKEESKLKVGKYVDVPIVGHRQIVDSILRRDELGVTIVPNHTDFVLFSQNSKLGKGEKISIRNDIRMYKINGKMGEIIHQVAEYLIGEHVFMKVGIGTIRKSALVVKEDLVPVSTGVIRRYILEETLDLLKEHSKTTPLRTLKAASKFSEFLLMQNNPSTSDIVKKLSVSRSTAVEYKVLKGVIGEMEK